MYKHLITALALLALAVSVTPLWADESQQQQRNQQQQSQEQRTQQHLRACLGVGVDAQQQPGQHNGVAIQEVEANSPAAQAGLQKGDVITRVGNRRVEGFADLASAITRHQPGEQVKIGVQRQGQERNVNVTLSQRGRQSGREMEQARRQEEGSDQNRDFQRLQHGLEQLENRLGEVQRQDQFGRQGRSAFLGVQTRELTQEARNQQGIRAEQGVIVTDVEPGSAAADAGLREGDVITRVDGQNIANPRQLRQAVQRAGVGQQINMEVQRGNRQQELTARLEGNPGDADQAQNRGWQRLQHQLQQAESRIRELEQYGRWQDDSTEGNRDVQRLERRLQQLENRLREGQRQDQFGRQQDQSAEENRELQRLDRRLQQTREPRSQERRAAEPVRPRPRGVERPEP